MTYCYPVLDLKRYTVWEGCGFLDPLYLKYEKAQHPATDWNARTGGDTDNGDPLYAIADGRVSYMAYHRYIGNILLLELDDGSEAAYWHNARHEPGLKVGQRVHMGERVAAIGKGGTSPQFPKGRFAAHLHFEWRKKAGQCRPDEWPGVSPTPEAAALYIQTTRHDPAARLKELGALTTLSEVQAHYAQKKAKPGGVPTDRKVRVMLEGKPGAWQDVSGQRVTLPGLTLNATDPG
ncbi:MAG: M23 family metallopeptidase, partial [Deinococcus sp.]|nr:M23 family metallopeptidase [Deinococcus sp.]